MKRVWWKEGVIYQVYPRSFNDSNGDGIGDIPGVIEKLDYIKSLGVDIIWLCPVYKSPNDDNGYDIADYYNIMDEFGTIEDFDQLLEGVHDRGMKLIMDLVVNHTSDEHAWFIESRSSRDNPKRDYYIWKDGKNGGPPNNWQSFFGGDAWAFDEKTNQYYLRLFTKKQPDLNWENENLRKDVHTLMRYWLDKGIDGYRMDVISLLSKRNFEDTNFLGFNETIEHVYANGPKIHDYLQEMNKEALGDYDIMTVGEGPGISLQQGLNYVQEDRKELSMIFHFDHMFIDHGPGGKFDPVKYDLVHFKEIFAQWDKLMTKGGWSSLFLGNHDFPRMVSRFGNDKDYHVESAKALALMLFTMRGTPYIYQGDEIGMTNVAFDDISDYRDIETLQAHSGVQKENGDMEQFMAAVHWQGRDNARTPVQWDATANAGFSSGEPWIKVNPNYSDINVALQEHDSQSILNFYRSAVACRKEYQELVYADFEVIDVLNPRIFAYWRKGEGKTYLVLINFTEDTMPFAVQGLHEEADMVTLLANYPQETQLKDGRFDLKPWEAILYQIN
ncbi:MAG: alpha-glucosidase [Cyclobacteriaceae bacterium]